MTQTLDAPPRAAVPAVLVWASLLLVVAGIAISTYLTYEHFSGSTSFACPETGKIDCVKVTTSQYSHVLGIPVAVLGLAYFVAMAAVMSPPLWRSSSPAVRGVRLAMVVSGIAMVLYLVWAELFELDAICLYCTAVHAITLVLFVIVVFAEAVREPGDRAQE